MSQGDLANALEVSRQSVSKWETNTSVPELNKLVRMSEVFNISLDELIRGTKPEEIMLNYLVLYLEKRKTRKVT